jgi:glutathione S-transferase
MASETSFPRGAARRKTSGRSGRSRRPGCRIESTRSTTAAASSTARPTVGSAPSAQVPVIDDDGFVVAESAAVVLYLAEKAGKLIPGDVQGRTRVVQWCFAAVSTVEPTLVCLDLIEIFDSGKTARKLTAEVRKLAGRWLGDVERRLEDREWIACADFTVADIMMACVLRGIRKTDLMEPFPKVKAYYERCLARPAWQRTLALYAERIGVSVADIR